MNRDEFIYIVFKISSEEDIGKLIRINNLLVEKINIMKYLKNVPKANIVQKEESKEMEVKNRAL